MFLAALCSLRAYAKMRDRLLLIFFSFYVSAILVETASHFYSLYTQKSNHFIYNAFLFEMILFYYLVFRNKLKGKSVGLFIKLLAGVLFVFSILNLTLLQGIYIYNTYTHYAITYSVMAGCFMYFLQVLRSDEIVVPMKQYFFWVAAGIFISNMATITFFLFFYDVIKAKVDPEGIVYQYVYLIAKVIEYGFAIFAFLSAPKWEKRNLSL